MKYEEKVSWLEKNNPFLDPDCGCDGVLVWSISRPTAHQVSFFL